MITKMELEQALAEWNAAIEISHVAAMRERDAAEQWAAMFRAWWTSQQLENERNNGGGQ